MNALIRQLGKKAFIATYRLGLHAGVTILPRHFYSPVADITELKRTRQQWARRSSMTGIALDLPAQIGFLHEHIEPFRHEYRDNTAFFEAQSNGFGLGFGYVEAQALHGLLRSLQPPRIIEVGSGVSTYCALKASALNVAQGGRGSEITCIEPYPSSFLQQERRIRLLHKRVQEVPLEGFDALQAGDLLFIDSSHAVRPGGDVNYLYLEVLPRLRPGVIVHIHDIYFPYPYQRDLLDSLFQWQETVLLQALLVNNQRLEILLCLSLLHYDHPDVLQQAFPGYDRQSDIDGLCDGSERDKHFPASIYLRTT